MAMQCSVRTRYKFGSCSEQHACLDNAPARITLPVAEAERPGL